MSCLTACHPCLIFIPSKLNRVRECCHPDSFLFEHFYPVCQVDLLEALLSLKLPPHKEPQPVIAVMLYPKTVVICD